MKLNIKHFFGGLLFLSTIAVFSACSGSDDMIDTAADVNGLKIGLAIGDATVATKAETRAASDGSLKEDVINNLNVFFYQADGTGEPIKHYYLSSDLVSGQKTLLQSGSGWKSTLVPGTTYVVYAIANFGSMDDALTASELQKEVTDVTINKPYSVTDNPSKQFIMDYKGTWVPSNDANVEVPVTLKRAAAKILVKVNFESAFQKKITLGDAWKWNLLNFGTKAALLEGKVLDDKGVTSDTSFANSVTPGTKDATTQFVTYTYQNVWDDATKQTMVELNIPLTYNNVSYPTNKYKFPITLLKQTDRNYIYEVDATINALGNTNEPETANINYHVLPWLTNDIDITSASTKYLIVSPDDITLTNVDSNKDIPINFYSSSAVTIISKKAYYNDANGLPQYLDETTTPTLSQVTATLNGSTSGTISITSPVPTNLGPRYIELVVQNADGLQHTIKITQYPLEYITSITGAYSYKDDGTNDLGTAPTQMNYYDPINDQYVTGTDGYHDYMFRSKYFDGSKIIRCGYWTSDGQDNDHMYVVRITSTSSTYTIDRPLITNGVTDPSEANNKVVSPAFMIASQLGTVSSESWPNASDHCKRYVEVHDNGDGTVTKYADWRLPTLAELKIICTYQNNGGEVMSEVLGGANYWGAYHYTSQDPQYNWRGQITGYQTVDHYGYVSTSDYQSHDKTSGSCFIRCIRDMKPSELTK
jgi:hypothetical protein